MPPKRKQFPCNIPIKILRFPEIFFNILFNDNNDHNNVFSHLHWNLLQNAEPGQIQVDWDREVNRYVEIKCWFHWIWSPKKYSSCTPEAPLEQHWSILEVSSKYPWSILEASLMHPQCNLRSSESEHPWSILILLHDVFFNCP